VITVVGKDFFLNSAKIRYVDRMDGQPDSLLGKEPS
jgi:hypothetical protein